MMMTKFWFMTYSTSAALGWVTLSNLSAQAMEEVNVTNNRDVQIAQALPTEAEAIAAQPHVSEPVTLPMTPSTVAPPVILDVEPTPSVQIAPPTPEPIPQARLAPPAPAPRPMPAASSTPFLENDPVMRSAINPQTSTQREAVRTMDVQQINPNNRSFDDLISPSTADNRRRTGGLSPEQVVRRSPSPAPIPAPRATARPLPSASQTATMTAVTTPQAPPMLQQLERDLDTIRRDVTGSVRRAPLESGLMMTPMGLEGEEELSYFSPTNPNAPTAKTLWESVNLSTAFTMPTVNVEALKFSMVQWDAAIADLNLSSFQPWDTAQFSLQFEDLGFGADFLSETAVSFADLATEFDGMFGDWDAVFEAYEILPVTPAWQSAIALNTPAPLFKLQPSATDIFTQYNPTNPLTLGFKPDFRATL